jgi:hypothetical protein
MMNFLTRMPRRCAAAHRRGLQHVMEQKAGVVYWIRRIVLQMASRLHSYKRRFSSPAYRTFLPETRRESQRRRASRP